MGSRLFNSSFQALNYYHSSNPARAHYPNLLEPERGSKIIIDPLSFDHPDRVWAAVVLAIKTTLRMLNQLERRAFALYYLGDFTMHRIDVANALGVSKRTVDRYLEVANTAFNEELLRRGLIVPNEET